MNLPDNFSSIYKGSCEVTIDKCDITSRLRITDLCNMLQAVAGKHSALGGMSYFDMQKYNQAWVLSSMRIEIEKLPIWHETIEIITWIEHLKGLRSVRDFEVKLHDQKIIGANSLWVVLNTEKRRPEPIALPHDHLQKYPDKKPTASPFSKIDLTKDVSPVHRRRVVYSDLDPVHHVNNVKYIEWCLDCLPLDIMENRIIRAIDVNYIKEVKLNNIIEIFRTDIAEKIYFYIKLDSQICFAMSLELNT